LANQTGQGQNGSRDKPQEGTGDSQLPKNKTVGIFFKKRLPIDVDNAQKWEQYQ
jgi:hypothetical protein